MNKFRVVLLLSIWGFVAFLIGCKVQTVPKKSSFEFPATMNDKVKAEFLRQCEKGEVFYGMVCAQCHNVVVKRKTFVPDFPVDKILSYDIRMENPEHANKLTSEHVTTEELGYILNFLTYKKKNGISYDQKLKSSH